MTKYGIDPTVICQIIDLAKGHHIQTVILFGSRARGDFRRTSDGTRQMPEMPEMPERTLLMRRSPV